MPKLGLVELVVNVDAAITQLDHLLEQRPQNEQQIIQAVKRLDFLWRLVKETVVEMDDLMTEMLKEVA